MITNPHDTYLHGTHDIGAEALHEGRPGWVLSTEELGLNLNVGGRNYGNLADQGFNVIARLNYSHHGEGTIPFPHEYGLFAQTCAAFVARSKGCRLWVIGNEPNHENERKGGIPIQPEQYAQCFARCREEIKRVGSDHLVLLAAVAPYHAQPMAWNEWKRRMMAEVNRLGGCDGDTIHAYTRWDDPAMISSEETMAADTVLAGTFAGFQTYEDAIDCTPEGMVIPLRVITEFDKLDGWPKHGSGIYQAAVEDVAAHNQMFDDVPIHGLIAYRWLTREMGGDEWGFANNAGVQEDIRNAARMGIKPPRQTTPGASHVFIPNISTGSPQNPPTPAPDGLPPRDWDPRLDARGVTVETPPLKPGQRFWRASMVAWLDKEQSQGRHHILGNVWKDGKKIAGVRLMVAWPGKEVGVVTEDKSGDRPPFDYWYNYPMSPSLHEFSIYVANTLASERVSGIGMGFDGNPNEHTSTVVEWKIATWPASQPAPTQPDPGDVGAVPSLAHPVSDPRYRNVTQGYGRGVNREYYSQFKVDGVPLEGHNGIDFGTPIGTEIVAVDRGVVVEQANDAGGYGHYIKMRHTWGESLYAHLQPGTIMVAVGAQMPKGYPLAASGNSGKSTGPHLHFGMRVNPYNRQDGMGGYADPAEYLINAGGSPPAPPTEPPTESPTDADQQRIYAACLDACKVAARAYGYPWQLIAAQAWRESSFRPGVVHPSSGAMGLMQITRPTWDEWAAKLKMPNGKPLDPLDAFDNAMVGTAYLRWVQGFVGGDLRDALMTYGWGPGNWRDAQPNARAHAPAIWQDYADQILYGRDVIAAVLKGMGL